jgi:hypothetical protein
MSFKSFYVINNSGERELLSMNKMIASARRSGADLQLAKKIADNVQKKIKKDGIKTSEIYGWIKEMLASQNPKSAMKYSLKEAMRKLGPAGYWFEKYISKLYEAYGYDTKINQIVKGACTDYEIDVLLWDNTDKKFSFGECKYHNQAGVKVSISVILENYASFIDLKEGKLAKSYSDKGYDVKRTIITNTKFTSKSIDYADHYGLDLLGWKYPKNKGLEYYIELHGYYPVTILPSVNNLVLAELYERDILFAKDLLDSKIQNKLLKKTLNSVSVKKLIKETAILYE